MPWYSDQVLPFDITLCGTNEMGAAATMKIFGVERLGLSVLPGGLPHWQTAAVGEAIKKTPGSPAAAVVDAGL